MQLNLKGKVAMVAASSKGLGFGIAQELAREGAKLSIGSDQKTELNQQPASYEKKPRQRY